MLRHATLVLLTIAASSAAIAADQTAPAKRPNCPPACPGRTTFTEQQSFMAHHRYPSSTPPAIPTR